MMEYEELEGCELGTKEYWEKQYENEINNFKSHGDIGDIWFGEESIDRIIKWIKNKKIPPTTRIIDIGCGNSMTLVTLAEEGYTNLLGVDYSQNGIDLAREITSKKELKIHYQVCDILEDVALTGFDLAHDKGTYDAISLDPVEPKLKREKYIKNVARMLNNEGLLVITSCNWVEKELVAQFEGVFELKEVIPTPTFKFGNKVGNVVTSIVFRKL